MLKLFPLGCVALVILSVGVVMAQPAAADEDGISLMPDSSGNVFWASGPMEANPYWLGVECLPVMPALRAQLNLPEKQGLLVGAVAPDSPAAKAGIVRHDILMRVGNKPLSEVRDLIQAIDAAKGVKLKIELIRGGKPKTLEALPAKRPEVAGQKIPPPPEAADWGMVEKWLEEMQGRPEGQAERPPMQFRFIGPGAIVSKDVFVPRPLPADMSVVISKEGDKPAKITVKRGDKKWEVTEKQLDKLPADVRPFVEQMLGRGPAGIFGGLKALELTPDGSMPGGPPEGGKFHMPVPPPGNMWYQSAPAPGSLDARLQKRLDDMDRRIEKLLRAVEELHGGQGQQPAPKSHQEK